MLQPWARAIVNCYVWLMIMPIIRYQSFELSLSSAVDGLYSRLNMSGLNVELKFWHYFARLQHILQTKNSVGRLLSAIAFSTLRCRYAFLKVLLGIVICLETLKLHFSPKLHRRTSFVWQSTQSNRLECLPISLLVRCYSMAIHFFSETVAFFDGFVASTPRPGPNNIVVRYRL